MTQFAFHSSTVSANIRFARTRLDQETKLILICAKRTMFSCETNFELATAGGSLRIVKFCQNYQQMLFTLRRKEQTPPEYNPEQSKHTTILQI